VKATFSGYGEKWLSSPGPEWQSGIPANLFEAIFQVDLFGIFIFWQVVLSPCFAVFSRKKRQEVQIEVGRVYLKGPVILSPDSPVASKKKTSIAKKRDSSRFFWGQQKGGAKLPHLTFL